MTCSGLARGEIQSTVEAVLLIVDPVPRHGRARSRLRSARIGSRKQTLGIPATLYELDSPDVFAVVLRTCTAPRKSGRSVVEKSACVLLHENGRRAGLLC